MSQHHRRSPHPVAYLIVAVLAALAGGGLLGYHYGAVQAAPPAHAIGRIPSVVQVTPTPVIITRTVTRTVYLPARQRCVQANSSAPMHAGPVGASAILRTVPFGAFLHFTGGWTPAWAEVTYLDGTRVGWVRWSRVGWWPCPAS